jgi:hypothetical protein
VAGLPQDDEFSRAAFESWSGFFMEEQTGFGALPKGS